MNPRLIALSGPLAGQTFELGEGELLIGRYSKSDLYLPDSWVSRKHCVVTRGEDGTYSLKDLGSSHGTYINAVPIGDRELLHGDRVTIGGSEFHFLTHDEPSGDSRGFLLEQNTTYHSAAEIPLLDVEQTRPEQLLGSVAESGLRVLLRANTGLGRHREIAPFAEELLELTLEAIPADRAVLWLNDRSGDEPELFVRCRSQPDSEEAGEETTLSETVTRRVLEERLAILASDVSQTDALEGAHSLHDASVHSLICVPLIGQTSEPLGLLYLESRAASRVFDEEHLRLVSALAGLAAISISNLYHLDWLESERRRLQSLELEHDLIGESPVMARIVETITRVADSDSTVLLLGESGTGKELAAAAIHRGGSRCQRPFVAINCATLSETLLESEIFGHEKGAFTGADRRKQGKLEIADSGTLFLDEVAELPLAVQAKLLRVLQEREFERLGGNRPIEVDVRLIAATNRNLEEAIHEGLFRQDLYFRLNVISITMPPLRERGADVALLANHFRAEHSSRLNRPITGFSEEARRAMARYPWPGNVRELSNAVERAVVMGEGPLVELHDLPECFADVAAPAAAEGSYQDALRETKKRLIVQAMANAGGNYTRAAEALGLHPNYLHRLIRNLGIKAKLENLTS